MTDKAQLNMAEIHEFEYDPVGEIDAKAPNFVALGAQFFCMERWMIRIDFELFGFLGRFFLDCSRQLFEKPVKGGRCRDFNHGRLLDQLVERFTLGDAARLVVAFGCVQRPGKIFAVESDCVAKSFKVVFSYLYLDAFFRLFSYFCFKSLRH